MNSSKNPNLPSIFFQATNHALGSIQGNVLVYLIVLILIFGVLGVTIVSLFTTATSSSATPNNARRAAYVTESATRYAFSELRNSGFATGVVDSLNTTIYTVDSAGSFTLNIFSPWFVAAEDYRFDGSGGTLTLNVPVGKLTPAWMDKDLTGVWVINYDYLENRASARGPAASWATINDTTLTLTVSGDFNINTGERVCFMVKPKEDQTEIAVNGDLLVEESAWGFFPEYNGAININRIHYVYEQLVHESADNRVRLKKITAGGIPSVEPPFPLTVTTTEDHGSYVGDFIVLSPRNYYIIPTGTADTVSVAGTLDQAVTIYDSATVKPGGHPDISLDQYDLVNDLNIINRPGRDFIAVNNDDGAKTINIGNDLKLQTDFGGIWFDTDATIGGKANVCSAGACEFGRGVRVFFTLDYEGSADGLTFALISAINNTTSSIGGDINAGELLGYAGDSRMVLDPAEPTAATDFLDEVGVGENPLGPGLHPPKIALEFDTYNNNQYQADCEDDNNIENGNRNDPFSLERHQDALQFVFWGRTGLDDMPCRDYTISGSPRVEDHPTYDDNRHDVGDGDLEPKWTYPTLGPVRSTPAISDDGSTVYVGSDDGYLYAIDTVNGSLKWRSDTGGKVRSSPVVGPGGEVYVGSYGPDGDGGEGSVYAFNPADRLNQPDGSTLNPLNEWVFYTPNDIDSSPAIDADGKIYIGDNQGHFYALYPASRLAHPGGDKTSLNPDNPANEWEFTDDGFKATSKGRPAIGPDPTGTLQRIYITGSGPADLTLYALDPADGSIKWSVDTQDVNYFMPAADPDTGVIYTEQDNKIWALLPAGTEKWVSPIGINRFTPVVGNDNIIYAGGLVINSTGKLTKLDAETGAEIWNFTDSPLSLADIRTTPAIASDGTIYFGAGDSLLHALNPDGTKKWMFPIPVDGDVIAGHSSPTVGSDGTVYIGSSSDNKLYAVNDYAVPRNIKHNYVTSVNDEGVAKVGGEEVTVDNVLDWLNGDSSSTDPKGPWAVRLEVMRRSLDNNKYEYKLHAWIRQCPDEACEFTDPVYIFYKDTRIQFSENAPLPQTFELTEDGPLDFAEFIFGFTGATGESHSQSAEIANFNLSFIRPNDPEAP